MPQTFTFKTVGHTIVLDHIVHVSPIIDRRNAYISSDYSQLNSGYAIHFVGGHTFHRIMSTSDKIKDFEKERKDLLGSLANFLENKHRPGIVNF